MDHHNTVCHDDCNHFHIFLLSFDRIYRSASQIRVERICQTSCQPQRPRKGRWGWQEVVGRLRLDLGGRSAIYVVETQKKNMNI
jgi:hypothetical protein